MRQNPVDSDNSPLARVNALREVSAELLDRALDGWELFLDTFEAGHDE